MPRIALLDNLVKEYAWGSRTFIPRLLGKPFPSAKPQAELWMGAHPRGTSRVLWEGRWLPLSDLIKKDPQGMLGKAAASKYSKQIPFLFKVLAASTPLSIQAHPNQAQAAEGFERESREGIPLTAPYRNYLDSSHKPEMICALTPFWALKGFRSVNEIRSTLRGIGFSAAEIFYSEGEGEKATRKIFTSLFTMEREKQKRLVSDLVSAAVAQSSSDPVCEWISRLQEHFPNDMGVFGPVLLNLIRLEPGDALSISAGELHSYLDGSGIEVMANSDNVLRAGLTKKHVDVHELLKALSFLPDQTKILRPRPQGPAECLYPKGAEEFTLSRITLERGLVYQSPLKRSIEIMICVQGEAEVSDVETGEILALIRGTSIMVPALVKGYRLAGAGTLYKAAVPLEESPGD